MNYQPKRYTTLMHQIQNPVRHHLDAGSLVGRGLTYQERGQELEAILRKYALSPNSSEKDVRAAIQAASFGGDLRGHEGES